MKNIDRVPTGFAGLDRILEGGLPTGSLNLLSGACGTGKSTFAMQFLYYGAKYLNEPGVYVTLEEEPEKLVRNMSLFGWDIADLIKKKKIMVIKPEVYKFDSIKQIIEDAIEKIGARRLVVDSYSVMLTYFSDPYEIRNGLVQLDRGIIKMQCTALVISDIKDNSEIFSTTGVEEFIVDGVIVLYLIKNPKNPRETQRLISVRKMRATNHPLMAYPYEITGKGITIKNMGPRHSKGSRHLKYRVAAVSRPKKASHRKRRAAPKKTERRHITKKSSTVDLQSLRAHRPAAHSWKWKHL